MSTHDGKLISTRITELERMARELRAETIEILSRIGEEHRGHPGGSRSGDGEQQEGLIWEAAMAASKYRLGNLIVFVDGSRLQGCGPVEQVMPLEPLADKWESFGWMVQEIDGHDMGQILESISVAQGDQNRPNVILARTIKSKGVLHMEQDNSWHQRCPVEQPAGTLEHSRFDSHMPDERPWLSTKTACGEALLDLARAGKDYQMTIGKDRVLLEQGYQAVLVTSGLITAEALQAAALLKQAGISSTAIEFPTLKPLDQELVLQASRRTKVIFTIEEHNVIGGLGSAVLEVLSESCRIPVIRLGMPDCFAESGTPEELRNKCGLTAEQLACRIRSALHCFAVTADHGSPRPAGLLTRRGIAATNR